jgi:hypothetical protein
MTGDPGRDRVVYLRTTRDVSAPGASPTGRADAVRNTGNYFFEHALLRHLGDPLVVQSIEDVPEMVDRLVLSMANFISGTTDLGYVVECLERKAIRQVVMVGAGAQAYDYGDDIVLTRGTRRFLDYVADRSVSIGVRGYYTAELLDDLGIHNVEVIGCPAAFWSGPQPPTIRQNTLPSLPALCVNATPLGHFRDKVSALFAFAMRHEADYVVQSEDWIADLLARPVAEPYVPLRHADAVTYFANPACTPSVLATWLRRHARWFYDPQQWIEAMRRYDLAVGSRFHGNLAAIQAGTPALNLVFDTRTRELCDYLCLPYMMLADFQGDTSPGDLHDRADYSRFTAAYHDRFTAYVAFLVKNGLPHALFAPAAAPVEDMQKAGIAHRVRARVVRQIAEDAIMGHGEPDIRRTLATALCPARSQQERDDVESGRLTRGRATQAW